MGMAAWIVSACALVAQGEPEDPLAAFGADLAQAREDYAATLESNARLLLEGRMKDATAALQDVVPRERRTAAHAFLLGNVLFDMEPEVAMGLHEEAYAKAPGIGLVAFEWAVELHRAGRIAEAERIYGFLMKDEALTATHSVVAALRAECLLRLDRAREALASWRNVDWTSREIASRVEEAACWIHRGESPFARRDALLAGVDAGDVEAAEELILLDLDFARDWWNGGIHVEYLEADLERMRAKLPADDVRVREAFEFVRLRRERERDFGERLRNPKAPPASDETRQRLTALGLIGDDARLPASPRLTGEWMRLLVDAQCVEAPGLLERFEAALTARGEAGDVVALESLAALVAMTDASRLPAIDRLGLERTDSPRFAGSLLQAKVETIRSDDPDLAVALSKFPDDPRITRFAAVAAQNSGEPAAKPVAAHVAASFRRPFSAGQMDSLFNLLEKELGSK